MEAATAQRRLQLTLPGPPVPFGSRVVVLVRPQPEDDFAPRGSLATVFGQVDDVPKAMHVYRNGRLETTGNVVPAAPPARTLDWASMQVLSEEEPIAPTSEEEPSKWNVRALPEPPTPAAQPGSSGDRRAVWGCPACRGLHRAHTNIRGDCAQAPEPVDSLRLLPQPSDGPPTWSCPACRGRHRSHTHRWGECAHAPGPSPHPGASRR